MSQYEITYKDKGLEIVDLETEKTFKFDGLSTLKNKHNLPFEIKKFQKNKFLAEIHNNSSYLIKLIAEDDIIFELKEKIKITKVGRESDIIQLDLKATDYHYANAILNELIEVFNLDGIQDKQLIHKRTIDFVNERYSFLTLELDSIEFAKQIYKATNNLVDLTANSAISLEKSFKSEESIFAIENQISITKLLIKTLEDSKLNYCLKYWH